MKKVLVIAGLTASGKSALAVELAKTLNGEIISADSVAVYHELNIGSAKPTIEEQDGIMHHLINVTSIDEPYHVARFQKDARSLIDDITGRGKLPIIVGGTGLYINALIQDYRFEEEHTVHIDETRSTESLYDELLLNHPETDIHPNNRKRIIRALEIIAAGNKHHENQKDVRLYDAHVLFLNGDREHMYERMNYRVDQMFDKGLVDEVKNLFDKNNELFNLQSMQAIGYREFAPYFKGEADLDAVKEKIKQNTRRFAKRQVTWFRHQTENIEIDIFSDDYQQLVNQSINQWLIKTS